MWRNCKNGLPNTTRTTLEADDNSETETPQEKNTSDESPDNEQPEHIMESEDDSEQPDKELQQDSIDIDEDTNVIPPTQNTKKRPLQTSSDDQEQDGKQPELRRSRTQYKPNTNQARKKPNVTE